MTSEKYRTYLTESIKTGAQMMYDMAEDIAGKSDFISNLTVTIKFDLEMGFIPELTIERSHLPNQEQLNRLLDIRQKAKRDAIFEKTMTANLKENEKNIERISNKMKKIVCLTLVLMIVFSFIGCSEQKSNNTETDNTDTTDRFIEVYSDFNNNIFVDTETNVLYFWHYGGYSGGLCVMVDENGKPLLWDKTNE